jgi:hypothetical protein
MRDRYSQIGIDRLIRLAWLEKVAALALSGQSPQEMKKTLEDDLKPSFRSDRTDVRGSLDKTITILIKVWVRPPRELSFLQKDGLELVKHYPKNSQITIHWGMMMASYPFWANVATQVGRLLALQGTASAGHVQRRLREQYGERETVSRRTRYVLRSFVDWGVLCETGATGVYSCGTKSYVDDASLLAWLVEAALHSQATDSSPFHDLLASPRFFPFTFHGIRLEEVVGASKRLEVVRHGLDENLVVLYNQH